MRVFTRFYGSRWALWGSLGFWVQMAFTMLLGLLAGRLRWAQRTPELAPWVCSWMWVALAIGLLCGAAFTLIFQLNRVPGPSPIKLLGGLCYGISRPAMMILYVLLIVRLAQDPRWEKRLAPFGAAGRMPLSLERAEDALVLFDVPAILIVVPGDRHGTDSRRILRP
jgi:uncharacterized protein